MIYLVSLIVLVVLIACICLYNWRFNFKLSYDAQRFTKPYANLMYKWSYYVPFVWFNDNSKEGYHNNRMNKSIINAGLSLEMDARVFQTLKTVLLFIGVIIGALLVAIIGNLEFIVSDLLKAPDLIVGWTPPKLSTKLLVFMGCVCISFYPNLYLKSKTKQIQDIVARDIPVIQLFIILNLRSKKPVKDILFNLSKLDTHFKQIFEKALALYVLNSAEGLNFLYENVPDKEFKITIDALGGAESYTLESLLNVLEANMKQAMADGLTKQRRSDLTKLVYSNVSFVFPFVAIVLLGMAPLATYGMYMLRNIII